MKSFDSHLRSLCRLGFLCVVLVELFGAARLINLSVTYTWFGLLVTVGTAWLALEAAAYVVQRYWGGFLHWSAWFVSLVAVTFDAVGDINGLYARYSWYDQIGHFLGTIVAAIVILTFLWAIQAAHHHRELEAVTLTLTVALAVTAGVLYEIEEYLEDAVFGSHRLGDGADTANDLLLDLLGALLVVVFAKLGRTFRQVQ